ncbi:hypothetical protein FrEUN1fDRAFT_7738 [Parafrankia sp. EUN1f]|nr:hypothetical protein FrEUN1fDRAFT_7738 [Parafrankia sp. EUN1f]
MARVDVVVRTEDADAVVEDGRAGPRAGLLLTGEGCE